MTEKHHDQKQLEKKFLIQGSQAEAQAGTWGSSWCRCYGGALLTGLLLTLCSACFLIHPGPSAQGGTDHSGLGPPTLILN